MLQSITIATSMPTRKIFLDTSYLLALELANDQNHQAAQAHWQQVINTLPAFVTTSYIFDEVVTTSSLIYCASNQACKSATLVKSNNVLPRFSSCFKDKVSMRSRTCWGNSPTCLCSRRTISDRRFSSIPFLLLCGREKNCHKTNL